MSRINVITALVACGLTLGVGQAVAAPPSVATANVNMRAGPGTAYPVVAVVPQGAPVQTFGCLANGSWCDVGYASARGWVSAGYLTMVVAGRTVVISPRVSVPVVTFTPAYWNVHYTSYSWYRRGPAYYGAPPPRASIACHDGCSGSRTVTGPKGNTRSRDWVFNP